ncbi:MAG: alpha/beta family hydrolase [Thermoanaerobaculia bacterium]
MSSRTANCAEPIRFQATSSRGEVSALVLRPEAASSILVLGHGAGAGMDHPFLEALCGRLAASGMATLRYQFPYMEAFKRTGVRRRPDSAPILEATVRSAVRTAGEHAADLPVFAGGKSMGGRMSSRAEAADPLPGLRGLIFFGFPLHPAGRPGAERADHLKKVLRPMLFLQGTRDRLAELELLRPVIGDLGGRARLHLVDGADHSFHVLKRSGRTDEDALDELASETLAWAEAILEETAS